MNYKETCAAAQPMPSPHCLPQTVSACLRCGDASSTTYLILHVTVCAFGIKAEQLLQLLFRHWRNDHMSKLRLIRQSYDVWKTFHYNLRTTYFLLMTYKHQCQSYHCRLARINKTGWKEASLAGALQSPFVPSIIPFLVNINNITQLQLQFILTIGRVWHNAPEPRGESKVPLGWICTKRLKLLQDDGMSIPYLYSDYNTAQSFSKN